MSFHQKKSIDEIIQIDIGRILHIVVCFDNSTQNIEHHSKDYAKVLKSLSFQNLFFLTP